MKKLLLWLVFALLITSSVTAQDEGLHVDASASLGTISPYVYGSNLGLYSIIPPDLMPLAQAAGIKYMRFGGSDSDRQPVRKNLLDLFVLQSRMVGAEPAMTVRLLGGTPEQAAEVVHYANVQKDYNIRYWHIGNEPNLFSGLSGGDVMVDTFTTDDLNQQWRAIAEAMLEVDPDIMLVGPDVTQYVITAYETGGDISYIENNLGGHPRDSEGRDWLQEFLRANGDLIDIVSIHRYPYPGAGGSRAATATVEGLRENSKEWDTFIPLFKQMIRDITGRDIPIGVTEINSNSSTSSGGEASLDSFYNALWFGDVLGRLIRQQVEVVASWDMQGVGQRTWGLLSGDGVRPIYYTYIMYTHFGTELLAAESADPHVSIFASAREDGTLTLMVVNLGDDAATKTLRIDGFTPGGAAEVWLFDGEHNAEQMDSLEIADGTTITVPGRSMTLYAIPDSN